MRLRAFIGSSSETANVSNALKHNLGDVIDCLVWKDGFFRLSYTTLETLVSQVDEFDLGIFVFGADDTVNSRGTDYNAPRDNVVYEHGLFCGRLGPRRTFVVRAKTKSLKWLTDLEGFTAAVYDDDLAAKDADLAVVDACDQIRRNLDQIVPRAGLFLGQKWIRFGRDWWTYGGTEASSTTADEEGVQLITEGQIGNIGLMYPRLDNLDVSGRFCAVRLMPTLNSPSCRFYLSIRVGTERIFLACSDSHVKEGWGEPRNEFMIRLPHLQANHHKTVVIDLEMLKPYLGPVSKVNGFRIRPGVQVSHLCLCDELPPWLESAQRLHPADAPLITIEQPLADGSVEHEQVVAGTFQKATDLRIFVRSPDKFWHPQKQPNIENGYWKTTAFFGNQDTKAGTEFFIAAITGEGEQAIQKLPDLPQALGRSIMRVTRGRRLTT